MWRNCQPALLGTLGRLKLPTMNCLIKSLYHCLFKLSPMPPDYQVLTAAWPPLCAPYISNTFLTFFLACCQVNKNSLLMFLKHLEAPHLKCSFKADICRNSTETVIAITTRSQVGLQAFSDTDKAHLSSDADQQPPLCHLSHTLEYLSP